MMVEKRREIELSIREITTACSVGQNGEDDGDGSMWNVAGLGQGKL